MNIKEIADRYGLSEPKIIKEIDSSRGSRDYRKTFLIEDKIGQQLAIKMTNNCFTTPERIRAWQDVIEKYNKANVYAPRIVAGLDGEIFFQDPDLVIYAEEAKLYLAADEFDPPISLSYYEEPLFTMIGKIASIQGQLYSWPTAYCLYDVFCAEDETDENWECALEWYQLFSQVVPQKGKKVDEIWGIYRKLRTRFRAEYKLLPQATFQGDLNSSNILLNQEREFVGLIDFNLAGTETILNYALCESVSKEVDLDILMEPKNLMRQDAILKKRMELIAKNYTFTPEERAAYPTLYNIVVPFRWPTFFQFKKAIKENRSEYYSAIVDWVYFQITRGDLVL